MTKKHKTAKDITVIAVMSAMLIAVQLALSTFSGVELVSVMLAAFCAVFGLKKGIATAVCFSLLRCLIFGFFPGVVLLYLIYYPLFVTAFALIGRAYKASCIIPNELSTKETKKRVFRKNTLYLAFALLSALFLTCCFTLIDDIITPLTLNFTSVATRAYFFTSLTVLWVHLISVALSFSFIYLPLTTLLERLKRVR